MASPDRDLRRRPARRAHPPRAEQGVAETISSTLTVGITVIMMSGLAAIVHEQPGPVARPHTDLALSLAPGAGGWGDGDEAVAVTHAGGEPLPAGGTTFRLIVAGGPAASFTGPDLGSGFADGSLAIGEAWTRTMPVPMAAQVKVDVIDARGLVAALSAWAPVVSCATDTAPPVVAAWAQDPPDATLLTTGPVQVTAVAGDGCSGVDGAQSPRLYYRLRPGSGAPPAFTDGGAMSALGADRWSGTIPDPTWAAQATKLLEYYVSPLKDKLGNVGGSLNRTDLIQLVGATDYVASHVAAVGEVADFANAQSANDAGAEATLREANSAAPLTVPLGANVVTTSGTGWTNSQQGFVSDDAHAKNGHNNPGPVQYAFADQPGSPGTITAVVLKAEVSIVPHVDDGFTLQACLGASPCSAPSATLPGSLVDAVIAYDVTSLRPGGGPWSWADVNALNGTVAPVKAGLGRDGTWQVDRAWVEVAYTPPPSYRLDVQLNFTSGAIGTLHSLELRYRLGASGEAFQVELWDGSAWNVRGAALDSTVATDWSHLLSDAEWNAGAPRVRVVDLAPAGTVQGVLLLDYARVVTA